MNECLMSCAKIHDPFSVGFGAWQFSHRRSTYMFKLRIEESQSKIEFFSNNDSSLTHFAPINTFNATRNRRLESLSQAQVLNQAFSFPKKSTSLPLFQKMIASPLYICDFPKEDIIRSLMTNQAMVK